MQFSIIYSVDVPENENIEHYLPSQMELFDVTEDYSGDEYKDGFDTLHYLGDDWEKGSHKKLCAVLNREQFEQFLNDTGLTADSTETMGSIGAPGFDVFCVPAISFNGEAYSAYQNAYVTPFPDKFEVKSGKSNREENWYRIKQAILNLWG